MTMSTDNQAPAGQKVSMASLRMIALAAGALYLLTFVTSIPALPLYGSILNNPEFIVSSGADTPIRVGAVLEVICALAGIGTAIVLFPVVRRTNEAAALGFIASRVLEAGIIIAGVISLLSVLTLRQSLAGAADAATVVAVSKALVAFHDWTFLLGPGVMPGVDDLLLGYLLYRSALVPRVIPLLGLIGGPMLLASSTATLFGLYPQLSVWSGIATIPVFFFELSLGIWLVAKGFNPSAATGETAVPAATRHVPSAG
jgi:hypothetical protein